MAAHLDRLRLEARALPATPGVYFWKDGAGQILYIGKAVNLRARVTSYFSHARHHRRTRQLLKRARSISFEDTGTEIGALLRESVLIKQEQPPYNRALKATRRLHYIKLDTKRQDPFLEMVREESGDGSLYFGPFASAALTRETMAFLHDVLPLRKCIAAKPRCRPCVYFQMGKCAAPMIDADHRQRHQDALDRLFDLLDGRNDRVAAWLQRKRDRLSDSLLFEQAQIMQERLDALNDHCRQHGILEAAIQSRSVLVRDDSKAPRVLLIARGRVLSVLSLEQTSPEKLTTWIKAHEKVALALPRDQNDLDAASVLERWLHSRMATARWVAIPESLDDVSLRERAAYLVGSAPQSGR